MQLGREGDWRLLLVDDNIDGRDLLARILSFDGWSVVTAADGVDALSRLHNGLEPAIIVTDYMMPRLDGLAMLAQIRDDPALPNPPAVLVSAMYIAPELYHGRADVYFEKPFDLGRFRQTLIELRRR